MINILKHVLLFLIIISASCLNAEEHSKNSTRFYMELDLYTGLKAGICLSFNDRIDIYASGGVALVAPTQISYNAFAAFALRDAEKKLRIDLNAGIIHGVFDVIGPQIFPNNPEYGYYYYVNPGIAFHFSYPIAKNLRTGIRLGSEIMIGYDMGSWRIHPQPQPNAALTLTF